MPALASGEWFPLTSSQVWQDAGSGSHRISGHAQADPRFSIAVLSVLVAADRLSFEDFSIALMNSPSAALPPVEVILAWSALSVEMYAFRATAALDVGSDCSGVSVEMTFELTLLMIAQSAADGLVAEPVPVELAADVADAAAEVGVELADELDELQPAIRAPPAASTARAESDERLDISGTSMGWNGSLHLMRIWF